MNLCRTCESALELVNISEIPGVEDLLITLLNIPTHLQLPLICQPCIFTLQEFNRFKVGCQNVDSQLRKQLNPQIFKAAPKFETTFIKEELPLEIDDTFPASSSCEITFTVKEENQDGLGSDFKSATEAPEGLQNKIKCQACGKYYLTQNHVCLKEKRFKCLYCEKIYITPSERDNHMNIHTKSKVFTCDICSMEFFYLRNIRTHVKTHLTPQFKCDECSSVFKRKYYLNCHKIKHERERKGIDKKIKQFECSTCGTLLATKTSLMAHVKSQHADAAKFTCSTCGLEFKNNYNLKMHRQVHAGKKSFACSVCGMAISSKHYLKVHEAAHAGKKYACEVEGCNADYSQPYRMKIHMWSIHGIHWNPENKEKKVVEVE